MHEGLIKKIGIVLVLLIFTVFSFILMSEGRKLKVNLDNLKMEEHAVESTINYLNKMLWQNDKSDTISIKTDKSLSQKAIVFSGKDKDKWIIFHAGNLIEVDSEKDKEIDFNSLAQAKKISTIKGFRADYEYKNNIINYEIIYDYAGEEKMLRENLFIRTE